MTRRTTGGRTRDVSKDAAIRSAARDAFFEHGFNGTTMEQIAALARVSKVTLYSRYPDKETLFETVVRDEMRGMVGAFQDSADAGGPLVARLNAFGVALLTFLFRPAHVALDRMLGQEFGDKPELGRRFFDAGPGHCRARLAAMLVDAQANGDIVIDDPLAAAADLLALWRGFADIELKCGIRTVMDAAAIAHQVNRGTHIFLRATAVA